MLAEHISSHPAAAMDRFAPDEPRLREPAGKN
jgi:hypothetical protein